MGQLNFSIDENIEVAITIHVGPLHALVEGGLIGAVELDEAMIEMPVDRCNPREVAVTTALVKLNVPQATIFKPLWPCSWISWGPHRWRKEHGHIHDALSAGSRFERKVAKTSHARLADV